MTIQDKNGIGSYAVKSEREGGKYMETVFMKYMKRTKERGNLRCKSYSSAQVYQESGRSSKDKRRKECYGQGQEY